MYSPCLYFRQVYSAAFFIQSVAMFGYGGSEGLPEQKVTKVWANRPWEAIKNMIFRTLQLTGQKIRDIDNYN